MLSVYCSRLKNPVFFNELEGYLEEHIFTDAKSVIAYIYKQYKLRYSLSGVTDLLHRLGFSYKKPTHVPGKQDPAKQQAFLEEYEQLRASKGKNDPIYFTDATHPQHNSVPSYGWIKKGREKELKANCGRQGNTQSRWHHLQQDHRS